MTTFDEFVAALSAARCEPTPDGNGYRARCPAHDDRTASLAVTRGDKVPVVTYCHAGCEFPAIVEALRLPSHSHNGNGNGKPHNGSNGKANEKASGNSPTFDSPAQAAISYAGWLARKGRLDSQRKPDHHWPYGDAAGRVVCWIARWDIPDDKIIVPISRNGTGWICSAMPEPRPLYNLPSILKADSGETIYVVEGEKAADSGRSIGLNVTTSSGGSKAAEKTDWSPLSGRHVVILPDHDEPGRKYAEQVDRILNGKAASIRIVTLPGLASGGDLHDYVAERGDDDPAEIRADVEAIAAATGHTGNGNGSPANTGESALPLPLPAELAWKPLPVEVFPQPVQGFVVASSKAIGCDPSYIALPTLACLARAIGNRRTIRLKRTWAEPAIVWAAIVGKSGTHKTPALNSATDEMRRLQEASIAGHVEAMQRYEQDRQLYERAFADWKRKKGNDEPPPWEPDEPACNRFLTTDTTVEALASMLAKQDDGIAVVRDELAGWLGGIAEYKGGSGSDLGHWLATWSAQPLTVDRKTGATKMIHVPRAAVSLVGGIQPAVLRSAIGREHMADGLCARMLLAYPPSRPVRWSEAIVDPSVEDSMRRLYELLLSIEPAADEQGKPIPFPIPLNDHAKLAWIEYYNRHRAEIADLDDDLAAAWSKLEAYTARFALIFQLVSWAAGDASPDEIDATSMESAVTLSDWFGHEARRCYSLLAETDEERQARELVELIERKGGVITVRELMHASRRYRDNAEVAEAALITLAEAGWGTWAMVDTAGRQRREFRLTPPGNGNTSP